MAYATRAEVRALDSLQGQAHVYTDAMLDDGIDWATQRIDDITGTAWEPKPRTIDAAGNGTSKLFTSVPHIRTVTAATIDGVAVADTSTWRGTKYGDVIRPDGGYFPCPAYDGDLNVNLTVTAAKTTTPPDDIQWACRTLARWYVLQLLAKTPSNALQQTNELGIITFAQPGDPRRPTALPEVNAVLMHPERNHRIPGIA